MEPHDGKSPAEPWWRNAVIYEVYIRSFADSDGDGVGDLAGVRSRLGYLRDLGVDGIWLTPFYRSPMADHGYDVADHRDVDPTFGDLAAFDALLRDAHALGLKVLLDLVPNHSSDTHPAFRAAVASQPGSAERQLYVFRDGSGPDGALPPNNWVSVFGGSAWTRLPLGPPTPSGLHTLSDLPTPSGLPTPLSAPAVGDPDNGPGRTAGPTGSSSAGGPGGPSSPGSPPDAAPGQARQWYLHLFAVEQPDWNWDHPQVRDDHERTLRFWLDRGVDGFRIDVAHGLVKDAELRDNPTGVELGVETGFREKREPYVWDQDGVHEIYRSWRRLVDDYDHRDGRERVLVGEAWVADADRLARYVRPDELHLTFAFSLLAAPWSAAEWQAAVSVDLAATARCGSVPTWVIANHDVVRPATRYGAGELGVRRARVALVTLLALPGAVFLYQGDELGLPQVDVPPQRRQDPVWRRSGGTSPGRDGARVPMPWSGTTPPYGFAPAGVAPWLPQPPDWAASTADTQGGDATSTLALAREALRLRHTEPALAGSAPTTLRWWEGVPPGCVIFDRLPPGRSAVPVPDTAPVPAADGDDDGDGDGHHGNGDGHGGDGDGGHLVTCITCVMSTGGTPVRLTVPGRLVLASNPVVYDGTTLTVLPDTAAWLATRLPLQRHGPLARPRGAITESTRRMPAQ